MIGVNHVHYDSFMSLSLFPRRYFAPVALIAALVGCGGSDESFTVDVNVLSSAHD